MLLKMLIMCLDYFKVCIIKDIWENMNISKVKKTFII